MTATATIEAIDGYPAESLRSPESQCGPELLRRQGQRHAMIAS